MGKIRNTELMSENLMGRYNLEELGMDGKISKWILKNEWRRAQIHLSQDDPWWLS
jgi:hypothetical protein